MSLIHIVCFIFVFNDNYRQLFITNVDTQIWKKSFIFKKLKLHKSSLITIQIRLFFTYTTKEMPWMISSNRFDYHLTIWIFLLFLFIYINVLSLYLHVCIHK